MINNLITILLFPAEVVERSESLLVLVLKLFIERYIQKL